MKIVFYFRREAISFLPRRQGNCIQNKYISIHIYLQLLLLLLLRSLMSCLGAIVCSLSLRALTEDLGILSKFIWKVGKSKQKSKFIL